MKKSFFAVVIIATGILLTNCESPSTESVQQPDQQAEVQQVSQEKVVVSSPAKEHQEILKESIVGDALANLPERKNLGFRGPFETGKSTTWSLEYVGDPEKVFVLFTDMLGEEAIAINRKCSPQKRVELMFQAGGDSVSVNGSKLISGTDTTFLNKSEVIDIISRKYNI